MAFVHGLLLAFGLILPLGVQNVFLFNQGARQPRLVQALPAVFTAALCDLCLILLAVFGVSLLVLQIAWFRWLLIGAGVLFLLYIGWLTWRSAAEQEMETANVAAFSPKRQMMFAASVSLLNPHAILDTIGVIGTNSLQYSGMDKVMFTTACALVSLLWFFALAWAGRLVGRLNRKLLVGFNRVSAVIMWGSAGYLLWNLFA